MGSISHHIMPLVINSLGADTQTYTHTYTHIEVCTEKIVRNQAFVGLRPVRAWFKNYTSIEANIKLYYMLWLKLVECVFKGQMTSLV